MRCLGSLLLIAFAAQAQEPLPIRSAKLEGKTYTLTGRHTLDKSVRLVLGKGVRVIGQGKGAVLDLEDGSLEIAGEPGEEVVLENVWINLGWKFKRLKIVHAKFLKTGGVFVPHGGETRGKAVLENVAMTGDASVWVTFHEGGLVLRNVTCRSTCQIASTGSDRNVKLEISGCRFLNTEEPGVIKGGLRLHHVKEARVTNTQIGGISASFTGGVKLTLEGCRFDGGFYLRQEQKGRIGKTKISRCDFTSDKIVFEGPRGGREKVTLKECHFKGDFTATPDEIVRYRIKAEGVKVVVKSPRPAPLEPADPAKSK